MVVPTHIALSALIAVSCRTNVWEGFMCGIGALLPDIDNPRSWFVGRPFFFLSQPLNLMFGHRGVIHSLFVWSMPIIIGQLTHQPLVTWLGIGALSHCIIDCYSTTGSQLFAPLTKRNVVIFKKDWRVTVGSVQDIAICALLTCATGAMIYTNDLGGPRKLINMLAKSPQITAEEYTRIGTLRCYAKGSFRWTDGRTEDVQWLIIGMEGISLVYFDGQQLIREKHGKFLRSTLVQTNQQWLSLKTQGIVTVKQPAFFFDTTKWHYAAAGQKAFGLIRSVENTTPEIAPVP